MTNDAAINTGSAFAIGGATARLLSNRGWNVVGNYPKSANRAVEVPRLRGC